MNPPPLNSDQIKSVIQGPGDIEWRYEMRRECQEILPGLLLGPFVASKSLETLRSLNITHIVCIRDAKEAFSVRPRFQEHFHYMTLDVEDNEEQNLIRLFPQAKTFIDNAILQGGRVLVHCNGGISLSPAFVVMFAMQYYQISWEDALHLVQNRRYCISPNGGFLTQIKQFTKQISLSQHIQSLSVRCRGGREMMRMTKRIPIERMIAKEYWLRTSQNLSMILMRWRHSTRLFTHSSLLHSDTCLSAHCRL